MNDEVHKAALLFVRVTIGPLNDRKTARCDAVEIDALARLRVALGLCRECGGDKSHSIGSALRCICPDHHPHISRVGGPVAATVLATKYESQEEHDEAMRLRQEPDPDYMRDARRNGDFDRE